ncbi:MAG: hypothetical protein RMX96_28935 [Nostoc sp. ChiSLP02]|nr:hypothetical protein [Nostoc sp. DedSLP05]MDZ8097097.1 hypothetical protein [Nostoc sp. DedSLP01]MDZ8188866.1 hypothetical protein [Nostoc sp. ChiSLP02]
MLLYLSGKTETAYHTKDRNAGNFGLSGNPEVCNACLAINSFLVSLFSVSITTN